MEYVILRGCDRCGAEIPESKTVCDPCNKNRTIRELRELIETLPDHALIPSWKKELESLL